MLGKIIRGVGGFYYVYAEDGKIYECRAKGIFRKERVRPLVGDNVRISVLDAGARTGNLGELLPRTSELERPAAANVDQALVVFAAASPKPNLNLLDRFLLLMQRRGLPVLICFNKTDLVSEEECAALAAVYRDCGNRVFFVSAMRREGTEELRRSLDGYTTVLAGPSGVGKSSLTNLFLQDGCMEVGAVSRKTERGRHTTRHTELLVLSPLQGKEEERNGSDSPGNKKKPTCLLDTPGFSSLWLADTEYEQVKDYFPEFAPYQAACRFRGCMHRKEPDCAVRAAVAEGKIHPARYESYVLLTEELEKEKKYGRRFPI